MTMGLREEAIRELHDEIHAERAESEKREREYCSRVTTECLRAIEFAADAGRAPRVSLASIQEALQALKMAEHFAELLEDMSK